MRIIYDLEFDLDEFMAADRRAMMFRSNSEREAYENVRATPITDQLANVPADARQMYEHSTTHHQNIPFGRMAADALAEIQRLQSKLDRMRSALHELHATVRGECPSLLNEDSGGNGQLAVEIEDLLQEPPR